MNYRITIKRGNNEEEYNTADIDQGCLEQLKDELAGADDQAVSITVSSFVRWPLDEQKKLWEVCRVIEEADCQLSLTVDGKTYKDPMAAVISCIPDDQDMRRHEQGLRMAIQAVVTLYSPIGYSAAAGRIAGHLGELKVKMTQARVLRQIHEAANDDEIETDSSNPTLVAVDYMQHLTERAGEDVSTCEDFRVLHYFNGEFYEWQNLWVPVSDKEFQAKVTAYIQDNCETDKITQSFVKNVIANLEGLSLVEHGKEPLPFRVERYDSPMEISRPQLLLFENGMINISAIKPGKRPRLLPTDPRWFSTVKLPYDYDPEARCPQFNRFIRQVLEVDTCSAQACHEGDHRIQILQEFFGYSLMTDSRFQKFLVLHGEGSNGKSVVLHLLTEMLGRENVSHVGLDQLSGTFGLQPLLGKTANICGDLNELDGVAEGVLKQLTGQDNVTVHRKNITSITMSPSIKLIFSTNTLPRFKDRSHGVWRRLIVMPFSVSVSEEQQDPELPQKLQAELPGILNWAISGLRRLLSQGGFTDCSVCQAAKSEHQVDCDPILQFVDECITFRPGASMTKEAVYKLYTDWCKRTNHMPLNEQNFKKQFAKLEGVDARRGGTGKRPWLFTGVCEAGSIPEPDRDSDERQIYAPEDANDARLAV